MILFHFALLLALGRYTRCFAPIHPARSCTTQHLIKRWSERRTAVDQG
jgi:hypothetical protein